MKKISIFTFGLLLATITSCSKLETPKMNGIINVAPASITKKDMIVKAEILFENPNEKAATFLKRNISVFLNNRDLALIDDIINIENGTGSFAIPFDVTLNFRKAFPDKQLDIIKMTNILTKENNGLRIEYKGTVTLDIDGTEFVYDINHTNNLFFKKK